MIYLVFLVYLVGFFISIHLFKQINKGRKSRDMIEFDDAVLGALLSWFCVICILLVAFYNKSLLKTKIDDYIKSFEEVK